MDKFSFLYEKKQKKEKEFVQEYLYIEDYIPDIKEKESEEEMKSVIIIDLFGE